MAWRSRAHSGFIRELSAGAGLSDEPSRRDRLRRPQAKWEAVQGKTSRETWYAGVDHGAKTLLDNI